MRALLHQTDLFHPHGDPDDHFDMACVYGLARRGALDLKGVLIDYPPAHRKGDPDVMAVAQLDRLCGRTTPVAIGSRRPPAHRNDHLAEAPIEDQAGMNFLLKILSTAEEPVAVTCVGSAIDIAAAGKRAPELFAEKCTALYLNAGATHPHPEKPQELEFNVRLNPQAYAALFDLPCPLYWAPCWHECGIREVGEWGSFYWLAHTDILPHLHPRLQHYFAFMFAQEESPLWLRALAEPSNTRWREDLLRQRRGMWSTASLLHAAGYAANKNGLCEREDKDAVFAFVPANVRCDDDGRTHWSRANEQGDRYILRVKDTAHYASAMTAAVKELLEGIG